MKRKLSRVTGAVVSAVCVLTLTGAAYAEASPTATSATIEATPEATTEATPETTTSIPLTIAISDMHSYSDSSAIITKSVTTDWTEVLATVKDSTGKVVFSQAIEDVVQHDKSGILATWFTVEVPEWTEGSEYTLTLENLWPSYNAGVQIETDYEKYTNVETVKGANGLYTAVLPLKYYVNKVRAYVDSKDREGYLKDIIAGVDNYIPVRKQPTGVADLLATVVDNEGIPIEGVTVVMTTEKGTYEADTISNGMALLVGSNRENVVSYAVKYRGTVIQEFKEISSEVLLSDMTKQVRLQLLSSANDILQFSNSLQGIVTNPERVDFSLIGDVGSLGVELEVLRGTEVVDTAYVNALGTVPLLTSVEEGSYTVRVVDNKGLNVDIGRGTVAVKGTASLDIKLKANRVLAIKDSVSGSNMQYSFASQTMLGDKKFSGAGVAYYAVDEGTYSIKNEQTGETYDVTLLETDTKRVKVLDIGTGLIEETGTITVEGDTLLNPDTSDSIITDVGVQLGLLSLLLLLGYCVRRKSNEKDSA